MGFNSGFKGLNQEREANSLLTESRKTTTEQTLVKCRQWCEGF